MIIYLRVYDLGKYIRHILIYGLHCVGVYACVVYVCISVYGRWCP
jgi:hypothetical protein